MSQHKPPPTDLITQVRELLGVRGGESGWPLSVPDLEDLVRATRQKLLDFARPLGLTGLSSLTKEAIAKRVQLALQAIIRSTREPVSPAGTVDADAPHKFDLGLPPERATEPRTIPWGYGQDRVTAMVVDPERLYVYWEATDEAIARARAGLGAGGADAWLNVRVYDVTGRLFDGTNAHSYFDHKVERGDRQWFFHVGKPASSAVVELGLKSLEGYFVRVARSGRADFPRRGPAPSGPVQWLTVRTATGPVGETLRGETASANGTLAEASQLPAAAAVGAHLESAATPRGGEPGLHQEQGVTWRRFEGHWDWREIARSEWREGGRVLEWIGPVTRSSWEAGPFDYHVESPLYVEERHDGTASLYTRNGRLHVVYGPWQVVIRGLGARAERRVLGVWEVYHSWVASTGIESRVAPKHGVAVGGSELLALGASERRWLAASEIRLGGASEIHRVGASELRYLGASETFYVGASERRLRGASEWRYAGASEWRYTGASERRLRGASELRHAGASERRLGGASEQRFLGASESTSVFRRTER